MHASLLALSLLTQVALPPAQEVIESVVERTLADREELERRGVTYTKTQAVYNTKGRVTPELTKSETWLMWYVSGESRQRLIEAKGRKITGAAEKSPGPDWFVNLASLYDFSWDSDPLRTIDDRDVYVITFQRKKKLPKVKSAAEKGLVRMSGFLYIDVEHLYISTLNCSLPKSFRKGWVLKVNTASATFSQRIHDGLAVFDRMIIKFNYSFFGVETHKTYVLTYENYAVEESKKPPER